MVLERNQIKFQPGNCLNLKKPFPRECRKCIESCPHSAINDKKEIAHDKCTECGVCMAVCPSDGFVDRDMDNLGKYLLGDKEIILNCPLAEPLGYEISCLGMLDKDVWLTLLLRAESKDVKILTGDCSQCHDRKACSVSVNFLKELLEVHPNQTNLKIEMNPANEILSDENNSNSKNKNSIINIREKGKGALQRILLQADEGPYHMPKSRQWFTQALGLHSNKNIPIKALRVSEKCTSCGVCSKICPQNALEQEQKEQNIKLKYEPKKCVQCARCVDICGPGAIKLEYVSLNNKLFNGKILINESVARFCTKCGKQIFHINEPQLCMPCASKDPSLKGVLY